MPDEKTCLTMSVPQAGAVYFGLKPQSAYMAVRRGDIPVVRLGRTMRVPIATLERMLEAAGKKGGAE